MRPTIDPTDPQLRTLSGLITTFFTQYEPQILRGLAVTSWLDRLRHGPWSIYDSAIVAGMIIVFEPVQEALAHRYILHAEPTTVGPWALRIGKYLLQIGPFHVDIGKFHRDHHEHPHRLNGFVPTIALCTVPPLAYLLSRALIKNRAHSSTCFATWMTLALWYEWVHFSVHAPYQPKTAIGRFLREKHWRHHTQNENFWWVVSVPSPLDRLIMRWLKGIAWSTPDSSIPRSPTAKTIFSHPVVS